MKKQPFVFAIILFVIVFAGIVNAQPQVTKPIYYFNPDWSPHGKQIVFESTRDGKFAIYTINTDGSDLLKLTSGEANDEQPRWSPNGRQIVFISDRSGDLRLYLMNADGSGQHRIGNTDDTDYLPEFAPNGNWIVFQSRPEKSSITHDIFLIRTDGTTRTRLTDGAADYLGPRWSPDGKKILFIKTDFIAQNVQAEMAKMSRDERIKIIAKRNSPDEILIVNKDSSNVRNPTNNNVSDGGAEWSINGVMIYFQSERDGSPNIYSDEIRWLESSQSSRRKHRQRH